MTLDSLALPTRHRVTVMCDKQPQQSFAFRFSAFGTEPDLCLFLNDFYLTVQLWERKRAPWCKCEAVTR
jgi:hypothetical protein